MKNKKRLVSFILMTILVLSSIGLVNAEERDPGPTRGMSIIDPIDTTSGDIDLGE